MLIVFKYCSKGGVWLDTMGNILYLCVLIILYLNDRLLLVIKCVVLDTLHHFYMYM